MSQHFPVGAPRRHLSLAPFRPSPFRFGALLLAATAGPLFADIPGDTLRVSVGTGDVQGNDASGSGFPTLIATNESGRFVAFTSFASNLVPGDTNGVKDAFVHDRLTGTTVRASVGITGLQSNERCDSVGISEDGRYTVFQTDASHLDSNDINGRSDIYIFDAVAGTCRLASTRPDGLSGNSKSESPSISADGTLVCFWSAASDLVTGDTNGKGDIFVWNRLTGVTERVSVARFGAQANDRSYGPHISRYGNHVVFASSASNLLFGDVEGISDVFHKDLSTGIVSRLDLLPNAGFNGPSGRPRCSRDGRYVVFESEATNIVPGDTNGVSDTFVWDSATHTSLRASVDTNGAEGNGVSSDPDISANGQYVVFASSATNLVPGDQNGRSDVFLWSREYGWTERVSLTSTGAESTGLSGGACISADGRYVGFLNTDSLVPGDTNGVHDVYLRDRRIQFGNQGAIYCESTPNSQGSPAELYAHSSPIVADNSLGFVMIRLPINQFGFMLMSDSQAFVPMFGGSDGNLCLGGSIIRFSNSILNTASGSAIFTPDLTALPQGTVISPGEGWNFQFWFRDANPLPTSNTSHGICVAFR